MVVHLAGRWVHCWVVESAGRRAGTWVVQRELRWAAWLDGRTVVQMVGSWGLSRVGP